MTVGQRIAQKRKELSLSQEALGEKLGVSRQAIYKWESDQALPEVEKLVTLSRLFSVTVGWLLGEEESGREPSPLACLMEDKGLAVQEDGELSPRQAKMVQEIAELYIAAMPVPTPQPGRRSRWTPLLALACAVLAVGLAAALVRMNGLQSRYDRLAGDLEDARQSVSQRLEDLDGQIAGLTREAAVPENPDLDAMRELLENFGFVDIEAVDPEADAVQFRLWVPYELESGQVMDFSFRVSAEWEGDIKEMELSPGQTAGMTVPMTDRLEFTLEILTADGRERRTVSRDFYDLVDLTFSGAGLLMPDSLLACMGSDGVLPAGEAVLGGVRRDWWTNSSQGPLPETYRVGLFEDQKLLTWYEPEGTTGHSEYWEYPSIYEHGDITLREGHVYCEAVVIAQEGGRERVHWSTPVAYSEKKGQWEAAKVSYTGDPAEWNY